MLDFSWSNILHSNVINFAIMIAFFAFLVQKLKVAQMIENMRASVQKNVEDSDKLNVIAKEKFETVKESLANVDEELNAIIKKAEETAKSFEARTREDLDKSIESIKQNIEKQVKSEENHIQASLMKNVSKASIEAAQRQIQNALSKDSELHKKYINDFINNLDSTDGLGV